MAQEWVPLPLDRPLFANLDPDAIVGRQTAIENGFINDLGGHTRFPGMQQFADLGGRARVYLHGFNGDLIAATEQGQVFRLDRAGNAENVTRVAVSGGQRVVFATTDRDLLMAAGGPIVRLRDTKTELLSSAAPMAAHIGWIDGFTVAVELNSGRFFHSAAGQPDQWDPLDTFAADGSPDNINSLLVTPFRELLLGGPDSIEQFERLPSGDVPFFRRWASGDGVKLPHGVIFADNAMWTINKLTEFVRVSGQSSVSASNDIGRLLESIDDWREAWIGGYPDSPLNIVGQKFILIQAPHATNAYNTKGVTLVYDYRGKRFFSLYGWNAAAGIPTRWPGWSHWTIWDRVFVGGEGKIYELKPGTYRNGSEVQRWLVRTAHIAHATELLCQDFRLRLVRGRGGSDTAPVVRVRCSVDGDPFGPWITESLGKAGERLQFIQFGGFGAGSSFQFEVTSTDDCPIDLIGADVKVEAIGH